MKPLHFCFISQEYPPESGWGGIGSYTFEMANGLADRGYQVSVICRSLGNPTITTTNGVVIHRINPRPDYSGISGAWRLNGWWPGFAWAAAFRARQIHQESRISIIETPEARADGLFLSQIVPSIKRIVRLHTPWIFVDQFNGVKADLKKKWIYTLERKGILDAHCVTSPTEAMVNLAKPWIGREKKYWIVANPINCLTFCSNKSPKKKEALIIGRLERRKGVEILSEVIPRVLEQRPEISFAFLGKDSVNNWGKSWQQVIRGKIPEKRKARVHFECLSRQQLINRIQSGWTSVLPSIWENFPYGLLEPMACGLPVIGTRVGGIPELIDDGKTGILVPQGDAGSLMNALSEILDDEVSNILGKQARKQVEEKFDLPVVIPKMLEVYLSVIDS